MPPQLALLICTIFVIYILYKDIARKSSVSGAIWIPIIWILIIGSRPVTLWLNPGAAHMSSNQLIEGSPLDRAVFLVLILIGMFILSRRNINWAEVIIGNKWIIALFIYFAISIIWSDFPIVSLKRWFKTTGNLVMILIVLTEFNPVESIKILIKRCAYILIPFSILLIKYYPHMGIFWSIWGGDPVFAGVAENKNSLGSLCLVSGLFLFWSLQSKFPKITAKTNKNEFYINISILLMIIWLFNKSNSATAFISLLIGVSILILLKFRFVKLNVHYIGWFVFFIILCSFLFFTFIDFDSLLSSTVNLTGHADTFWGRTILWQDLINMKTNPIIGTGFESFWLGERLEEIWSKPDNWWHPNTAHNGYLEIYINLGFIGLFFLLGVIISTFRKCKKYLISTFDYGRIRMSFLILSLLYTITEHIFGGLSLMWFIFLLLAVDYRSAKQFAIPLKISEIKNNDTILTLDENGC
jgi:O-antigen ligase